MTLLPRSLFGRLVLLLVAVVALAVLTSVVLFRVERANLLDRQFSETKIVQLQAIRAALAGADGPRAQRDAARELSREYGVQHHPRGASARCAASRPAARCMQELAERLRERLGAETEVRIAPRRADAVRARRRGGRRRTGSASRFRRARPPTTFRRAR